MCDTFVYFPKDKDQPVYFGKNSDREPNEAQQIVYYPHGLRENRIIKATYIPIKVPRAYNSVILSKPFHMWGAEMGVNERGVAIGNEAVFTKKKIPKVNSGLTGMDLVRIALEISVSARDAVKWIITYLELYGQNACGGYEDKKFFYHNSYIVTDPYEAFVLETTGLHWAFKRINGYYAISNGLTIEDDYDGISNRTISYAQKMGWTKKGKPFNFKKSFESFWMSRLASSEKRRSNSVLKGKQSNKWTPLKAFEILRSHGNENFNPDVAKTNSICMHASGTLCPHQTTGSMVAVLEKNKTPIAWMTGSANPCMSIFKPFYFTTATLLPQNFLKPTDKPDHSYWWQWELFNRKAIRSYDDIMPTIEKERAELERKWVDKVMEGVTDKQKFSSDCLDASFALLEKWEKKLEGLKSRSGGFFYNRFWEKQNRVLGEVKI